MDLWRDTSAIFSTSAPASAAEVRRPARSEWPENAAGSRPASSSRRFSARMKPSSPSGPGPTWPVFGDRAEHRPGADRRGRQPRLQRLDRAQLSAAGNGDLLALRGRVGLGAADQDAQPVADRGQIRDFE
jgi:hypothetical protein